MNWLHTIDLRCNFFLSRFLSHSLSLWRWIWHNQNFLFNFPSPNKQIWTSFLFSATDFFWRAQNCSLFHPLFSRHEILNIRKHHLAIRVKEVFVIIQWEWIFYHFFNPFQFVRAFLTELNEKNIQICEFRSTSIWIESKMLTQNEVSNIFSIF